MVAVTYVLGMGAVILLLLGGCRWAYVKSRRGLEHPQLGSLELDDGLWSGCKKFKGNLVRIELPGDKEGPFQDGIELLEQLWSQLDGVLKRVEPIVIEDFGDNRDDESDQTECTWALTEVHLEPVDEEEEPCWRLEFDVAWDEEHSRAAYLDTQECQLLAYDRA